MTLSFFKKTVLLTLSATLASCGGGGDSTPAPLTKAQRSTLDSTMKSTVSAGQVTGSVSRKKKGKNALGLKRAMAAGQVSSIEPNYTAMSDYLENSLDNCETIDNLPEDDEISSPQAVERMLRSGRKIGFFMGGEKCPVIANLQVNVQQTGDTSGSVSLDMSYEVQDKAYAAMNDVTAFSFKSTLNIAANARTESGSITAVMDGQIISTSQGKVGVNSRVNASGNNKGGSGEATLSFVFKDFTAQYKLVAKDNTAKLTLNGEEISPEQAIQSASVNTADTTPSAGRRDPGQWPTDFPNAGFPEEGKDSVQIKEVGKFIRAITIGGLR